MTSNITTSLSNEFNENEFKWKQETNVITSWFDSQFDSGLQWQQALKTFPGLIKQDKEINVTK